MAYARALGFERRAKPFYINRPRDDAQKIVHHARTDLSAVLQLCSTGRPPCYQKTLRPVTA